MDRSHDATAPGLRIDAVERTRTLIGFESSPGFREKLAEREESIRLGKGLFHKDFLEYLNIPYPHNDDGNAGLITRVKLCKATHRVLSPTLS
jgi:hypothetical protein